MMPPMRVSLVAAVVLLAALTGCAGTGEIAEQAGERTGERSCHKDALDTLVPGRLTFAADEPVYHPWYINNQPENGQGYESAVAYAVADKLGYRRDEVRWVRVPFNEVIAPGPKNFDAALEQVSITDERAQWVDFSAPYYNVTQAFLAMPGTPADGVTDIEGLRGLRMGAQAGSTSLDTARRLSETGTVIDYPTNEAARDALAAGRIEVLVVDLPTAFSMQFELPGSIIVGQLPPEPGNGEEFGIVLPKDSPLTECVSWAVDELGDNGDLFRMQKEWLTGPGIAPLLSESR